MKIESAKKLLQEKYPNHLTTNSTNSLTNHFILKSDKQKEKDYYVVVDSSVENKNVSEKLVNWMKINRNADNKNHKMILVVSPNSFNLCKSLLKTWRMDIELYAV